LVAQANTSETKQSHAGRSRASESVPQKAEEKVERTGSGVAHAAPAVRGPLTLGAGILGGLATGLAIGLKFRKQPRFGRTGKALGELARVAGAATKQLAHVAVDVEKVREQVSDSGTRASPIEVLLQGLTHRRR
jgi:hypothetical protein